MSLINKFAALKFDGVPVKPAAEVTISEEWSRLLSLIEPVYPEMHQYFLWLAKQGVPLKDDDNSAKRIVLTGTTFECLPAISIEINPEKRWPDGAILI